MDALGLGWMFDHPRWRTAPEFETEAEREAFWEILLEAARQRTLEEWEAVFRERPNVWAELFRTTREALASMRVSHAFFCEIEPPQSHPSARRWRKH